MMMMIKKMFQQLGTKKTAHKSCFLGVSLSLGLWSYSTSNT